MNIVKNIEKLMTDANKNIDILIEKSLDYRTIEYMTRYPRLYRKLCIATREFGFCLKNIRNIIDLMYIKDEVFECCESSGKFSEDNFDIARDDFDISYAFFVLSTRCKEICTDPKTVAEEFIEKIDALIDDGLERTIDDETSVFIINDTFRNRVFATLGIISCFDEYCGMYDTNKVTLAREPLSSNRVSVYSFPKWSDEEAIKKYGCIWSRVFDSQTDCNIIFQETSMKLLGSAWQYYRYNDNVERIPSFDTIVAAFSGILIPQDVVAFDGDDSMIRHFIDIFLLTNESSVPIKMFSNSTISMEDGTSIEITGYNSRTKNSGYDSSAIMSIARHIAYAYNVCKFIGIDNDVAVEICKLIPAHYRETM